MDQGYIVPVKICPESASIPTFGISIVVFSIWLSLGLYLSVKLDKRYPYFILVYLLVSLFILGIFMVIYG